MFELSGDSHRFFNSASADDFSRLNRMPPMKSSPENAHDPSFDVRCLIRRFHSEIVLIRNVQFSPGYLGVRGSLYPDGSCVFSYMEACN